MQTCKPMDAHLQIAITNTNESRLSPPLLNVICLLYLFLWFSIGQPAPCRDNDLKFKYKSIKDLSSVKE